MSSPTDQIRAKRQSSNIVAKVVQTLLINSGTWDGNTHQQFGPVFEGADSFGGRPTFLNSESKNAYEGHVSNEVALKLDLNIRSTGIVLRW